MELENLNNYVGKQAQTIDKSAYRTLFRNVYIWMTLALSITGFTAFVVASSPTLVNLIFGSNISYYLLLFAPLGLVWYLSANINKISATTATIFFIIYSAMIGLTLSFIFLVYTSGSIALTFFVTAGTFGVMAFLGTVTKMDLSKLGNILFMALIGLLIASIANFFMESQMFYWIVTYLGVLIFVGLTVYDSHKIKKALQAHGYEVNETTQKIALMGALNLYLDFLNMFLFLLRILGSRK